MTAATPRRVLVVGAGRRVREAVLPVLACAGGRFTLEGILARRPRAIDQGGRRYTVEALDDLTAARLEAVDLVIAAVSKEAVPAVLRRLHRHDVSRLDLLVDTPVLRFRDLGGLPLLRGFRHVWVAEDCAWLPWIETVRRAAAAGGPLGPLREVRFERSAWHYHGHATAKALLGRGPMAGVPVVRARREREGPPPAARVTLDLAGGARATILEPRDYATGRIVLAGTRGSASDRPRPGESHLPFEIVGDGSRCSGFRLGDVVTCLDETEAALAAQGSGSGSPPPGPDRGAAIASAEAASSPATIPSRREETITSRMEDWKRVGLLRLLRSIDEGRGGVPLAEGLDDMLADHLLQKVGRYRRTPLTTLGSPLGRGLWSLAMRVAGLIAWAARRPGAPRRP